MVGGLKNEYTVGLKDQCTVGDYGHKKFDRLASRFQLEVCIPGEGT